MKYSNKELFRKFSEEHSDLPFSMNYSWWDQVVAEPWDVAIHSNEDQVFGIWPYQIRKRGPWKLLVQPHFTPYSGIGIAYPKEQKQSTRISFQQKVYESLIDQLPQFAELKQNFSLSFENNLPLIWAGFEDLKRYTYVLPLEIDESQLLANFRDNIRKQIKKAEVTLSIRECKEAEILKACFEGSFESQGLPSPIDDPAVFERILSYVQKNQCGKIWEAIDQNEESHAALCCIWDKKQAYYLVGGSRSKHKNSGAISFLLWEAIKFSKSIGIPSFNFEGSSIPAIEKYFRGFGGELVPFSCFKKNQSSSLELARKIKS